MQKRILSMLLALCLLAGILPPQAIAAGETAPFTDVKPSDWYYEGVEYVQEHNLMNGTGGGKFSPDQQMSRGMVATVLHRLAGTPATAGAAEFSDVPEGQWYSQAIAWAAEQQIVSGYGDNLFGVHDPITRQQLTAILYRYAQKTGADLSKTADLSAFTDRDQVSEYALAPMQWAVGSGLLTGTSATTLSPNGTASRGQIATILARFGKHQPEKGQFTVTFHLNYGENPVYQTQTVASGKTASKPANPTRSGHAFAGWHTKKEGSAPYDFAAPVTGDLVLYALWTQAASGGLGGGGGFGGSGSGSGSGSSGDSTSPYLYSITGVTAAEGKALVTVNTDKACSLQIRVLDDEGKTVLDTATAPTAAQLELENIQVPLNKALPEYFRLEASLLDENGKELCDKFLCVNYTSAYAAFDAATVDDFDGQIVLNFDEQPDENFGVLPKGAIQAQALPAGRAAGDQMMLDNTDHRLDQTKVGDIIAVYNAQGEVEDLVKVGKITLSENQALIQPDPDATLEDFYDLLKVDITIDADESMVDMSEADEGVTLVPGEGGQENARIGGTFTETLTYNLEDELGGVKLTGTAQGTMSLTFCVDWSLIHSYFYSEASAATNLTINAGINGSFSDSGAINLGDIHFVTPVPGLTVNASLELPYSWNLDGAASVTTTVFAKYGAAYGTQCGAQLIQKKDVNSTLDIQVEGNASLGIRPSLSLNYLISVLSASIAPEVGLIATASFEKHIPLRAEEEIIHACAACVDGMLDMYGKLTLKFSYRITDEKKGTPFNKDLAKWKEHISPFYLSISNQADSPLGGQMKFGLGQCPNRKYRTEFAVQDSSGQTVPDAQLTVSKGAQPIPDAAPGKALYLYNGDYTATAQAGSRQGSKDFKVNGKAQTVTVQLGKGADEPDNPDLTKLATPTNLTWGRNWYGNPMAGSIYWEQTDGAACYLCRIYDEDGSLVYSSHPQFRDHVAKRKYFHIGAQTAIEKHGSGTFYFTIQALSESDTIANSDIAISEKWIYTVPQKSLSKSSAPLMNKTILSFDVLPEENYVGSVLVEGFYMETLDTPEENRKHLGPTTFGKSVWPLAEEKYEINLQEFLNDYSDKGYGEGYYSFRIRIIPNDITQYRSSEWSEFSEPYHYIP